MTFRFITNNFGAKLLAVFLAVGMWTFVAISNNNVVKFPGSVPVKAINTPAGHVAIFDTKEVNLKIATETGVLRQLSSENFSAFIDLNGQSSGIHDSKVIVNVNIPNIQIIEVDPETVVVRIEALIEKVVGINAVYSGQVIDGKTVGGVDFDTEEVKISGPKSQVDLITNVTAEIKLNGEADNFTQDVRLKALNDRNEEVSEISIEPKNVNAKMRIVKAGNSKTVGIKIITQGMPASGYYVNSIITDPLTVDIIGQDVSLRQTQTIETQPIDITNKKSEMIKNVNLVLPSGISLQKDANPRVKVTIGFAQNQVSRELTATINYQNLNPSLRVNTLNPSSVKVIVVGQTEQINLLNSSEVVLNLDLTNKSTGTFGIDISKEMFKVPEGVIIASYLPSSVSINIISQ